MKQKTRTKATARPRPRRPRRTPRRRPPARRIFGLPVARFLLLVVALLLALWIGFHFEEVVTLLVKGLRDSPKHLVDLLVDRVLPIVVRLMRGH